MKQRVPCCSKIGVLFGVLIIFSMMMIGCSNDKQSDPGTDSKAVDGAQVTPETQKNEPLKGDESKAEEPKDAEAEETEDAAKEPVAFSYDEVLRFFELNTDTIVKTYGEPQSIREEDFFGDTGKVYVYDEAEFSLGYFDDDTPKGMVYSAKIANDTLAAPRDIKIGDSLESVLAKFPQKATDTVETSPNDPKVTYHMLYGEYNYMNEYGYMEYSDDQVIAVTYADQGIVVRIILKQDQVAGYEYVMPTT